MIEDFSGRNLISCGSTLPCSFRPLLVSRRSSPGSFPRLSFTPVHFSSPGGLVPRAGKKGECWTFLDWRLNSENDSPVHGQPSFDSLLPFRSPSGSPPPTTHTRDPANRTSWERNGKGIYGRYNNPII